MLKMIRRRGTWDRDAMFTLVLSTLCIVLSGGLVIAPALFRVLLVAATTPARGEEKADLLCFGKELQGEQPDPEYRARLDRVCRLVELGKADRIILMGGRTGQAVFSEAAAGRLYLERATLSSAVEMLLEEESLHTLENLRNVRDQHLREGQQVLLISNRYHLARCSLLAAGLGIDHALCAAEERFILNGATLVNSWKEALLIVWLITGKLWASITGNERMLARLQ
jgi:vancomycin permeability regulator SanA